MTSEIHLSDGVDLEHWVEGQSLYFRPDLDRLCFPPFSTFSLYVVLTCSPDTVGGKVKEKTRQVGDPSYFFPLLPSRSFPVPPPFLWSFFPPAVAEQRVMPTEKLTPRQRVSSRRWRAGPFPLCFFVLLSLSPRLWLSQA